MTTKAERRDERRQTINGAAYGQPLTDEPKYLVHNHGPEEGLGLSCPETRSLFGRLRGACMTAPEPGRMAPAEVIPVSPEMETALRGCTVYTGSLLPQTADGRLDMWFGAVGPVDLYLTRESWWVPEKRYELDATRKLVWPANADRDDVADWRRLYDEQHPALPEPFQHDFSEPEPSPVRLAVLDDARAAISGDRDATYGGPEDSFTRIAGLWEAQFGYHFDAGMVAQALALLKLARLSKNPTHRDSWVDLAGYAACGAEAA